MKRAKFICLVLLVHCVVWQDTKAQTEPQINPCNLKFEIKSLKYKYLPLEPIQLSYKITNQTDLPFEVFQASPDVVFSLEVRKNDNISSPLLSNIAARRGQILIPSNQKIEDIQTLNFNLLSIFPEYGKYQLLFTIYGKEAGKESGCKVTSNIVEIMMQEASGIDKEALNFIYETHESPIPESIFERWEDKRENKVKSPLEEFVQKYSASVYGDFAIFYLGNYYKYQKKYDLAIKEFNKLKDKKDFGYSKKVKSYLTEIEQDLLKIQVRDKEDNPTPKENFK